MLTLALRLAVTAPTEENDQRVLEMVKTLAGSCSVYALAVTAALLISTNSFGSGDLYAAARLVLNP